MRIPFLALGGWFNPGNQWTAIGITLLRRSRQDRRHVGFTPRDEPLVQDPPSTDP